MLKNIQLTDYFSVIIISGEIGIWKPDPGILHAALDEVSVKPSDCIYVGDSSVDIEAAISAGVDPVLIDRDNDLSDPFRDQDYSIITKFRHLIENRKLHAIKKDNKFLKN